MLRLKDPQLSLWDTLLPAELCRLNDELARVDELLDDDRFMAPFIKRFNVRLGRPTIPVETYLRLIYLKYRYNLGYEVLVKEVSDSIQWRRFCRVPITDKVPHSTTLLKLTKKYGPELLEELNHLLVQKARAQKVIRGRKLQMDTTVIEADIHYPTDASLLADGIRVITRKIKKLQSAGVAAGTAFRDRQRSVKKRILAIAKVVKRRRSEVYQEVRQITGEILTIARKVVQDAGKIVTDAGSSLKGEQAAGKLYPLVQDLEETITQTEKIVKQTQAVQGGNTHLPNRVVSIFDSDARPIKRGKVKVPVEFGYKILLQETEKKIITDYQVISENPADESLLLAAVDRHLQIFGRPPRAIATDRGFSSARNELGCQSRGISQVSLPAKGKLSQERKAHQSQGWFRRLQRWRAGGEATISLLKRKYGLRRSLFRGYTGTRIWVGFGILTYNLYRMAVMV